jgi:hypothetical protein
MRLALTSFVSPRRTVDQVFYLSRRVVAEVRGSASFAENKRWRCLVLKLDGR